MTKTKLIFKVKLRRFESCDELMSLNELSPHRDNYSSVQRSTRCWLMKESSLTSDPGPRTSSRKRNGGSLTISWFLLWTQSQTESIQTDIKLKTIIRMYDFKLKLSMIMSDSLCICTVFMNPDVKEDMSSSKAQSALTGQIQWPCQTPPILVFVQICWNCIFFFFFSLFYWTWNYKKPLI